MAVSYIDRQAIAAIAPIVCAALSLSETQYGWLHSAFSLAYLVATPLAGLLLDRVGARRGLLIAVLLWSLVAAGHAWATGFAMMVALRLALGLAEAPGFPGAAQTVHRVLSVLERGQGFAAIAPPLATGLAQAYGWRAAFVGTALAGLLWIPLWVAVTSSRAVRAVLDPPRLTAQAHPAEHYRDAEISPEKTAADPFASRWLIAHPAVWRTLAAVLCTSPMMAFVFLWGAKVLVSRAGVTPLSVGGYLWVGPVVFDLASIVFGRLSSARHRNGVLDASPKALYLAALLLLLSSAVVMQGAHTAWAIVAAFSLAFSGGGAIFALVTEDMLSRVSSSRVSTASGLSAAAQSVAYIIANPIIGAARGHFGYDAIALALALCAIPGALVWLLSKAPPRVG
jgi:ACS family hexuronate transporter-like MFS transporter